MPEPHTAPGYFLLGRLTRPQGVQGALCAVLEVDDITPYLSLSAVWIDMPGQGLVRTRVNSVQHKQREEVILKLAGVNDRNAAELLRQAQLWLPEADLPPLTGDTQFYYHELIHVTLVDEVLGEVGTVVRVIEQPAQDLIEVACPGGMVLVPLVDAFLIRLDRESQTLHMRLPQGLLDVYLGEDASEK